MKRSTYNSVLSNCKNFFGTQDNMLGTKEDNQLVSSSLKMIYLYHGMKQTRLQQDNSNITVYAIQIDMQCIAPV